MHSDLFSRPDSFFAVCFSIRNFDMPGDEISCPINVIFNGDNFAQWSQTMRSCDAPKPESPLTTRQPAENLYVSYYETYT